MEWVLDSLPFYSYRDCCRHWSEGRDSMQQELGLARDGKGRFVSLHPERKHKHSRPAMITEAERNSAPQQLRSDSSGQWDLL